MMWPLTLEPLIAWARCRLFGHEPIGEYHAHGIEWTCVACRRHLGVTTFPRFNGSA